MPDRCDHSRRRRIGRIDLQTPERSASFSVQALQRIGDLAERRPQLFEQTLTAPVTETLRVVRFSNRTPRRASSCRIEWLSADGVTSSRDAAARKLR